MADRGRPGKAEGVTHHDISTDGARPTNASVAAFRPLAKGAASKIQKVIRAGVTGSEDGLTTGEAAADARAHPVAPR